MSPRPSQTVAPLFLLAGMVAGCGQPTPPPALPTVVEPTPRPTEVVVSTSDNLALAQPLTASASLVDDPASDAVDGDSETVWNSGDDARQWIEIDLGAAFDLDRLVLVVAQYPEGETTHQVFGRGEAGGSRLLEEVRGITSDQQRLEISPSPAWRGVRYLKIETTQSPSWVAWRDIEVYGRASTGAGPIAAEVPSLIFHNGNLLTMDPARPTAQAIAVAGDSILAVGSDSEVLALEGPATTVIDLQGRTITPGFIDAHQHRIGNRGLLGIDHAESVIEPAIEQGLTTIHELYVDPGRLEELIALDQAGVLRLWVDAYLPVMENSPEGRSLGDYYAAYRPGEMVSPHVRVAGLKIFTDFDNATILLWQQEALNAFVLERLQEGWPLAIKTVSTRSLDMILEAAESAAAVLPDLPSRRIRLEHMLFASPDQIARIQRLGIVPVINFNNPGQLVGEAAVDEMIAREPVGAYTPYRNLVQASIRFASASGFPSYYVDEPSGAPFASPIHLIYQAVTRVGNLGQRPYPWLLDQAISAEHAIHALSIDGAYASFEEDLKGSLEPGKLADLVILSQDPLRVTAEQINHVEVWMTMIAGQVQWCSPGHESLCPGTAAPLAEAREPFVGDWTANDPADDSRMHLHVSLRPDGSYIVLLTDEKATTCGVDGAGHPLWDAEVNGTGSADGAVLRTMVTTVRCLSEPPTSRDLSLTIDFTYQPDTDTLIDSSQGAVWHRR